MSTEKRWLKQVIKEASDKHFEMPWEQDARPIAFEKLHTYQEHVQAA
jgi:hypothetical protein